MTTQPTSFGFKNDGGYCFQVAASPVHERFIVGIQESGGLNLVTMRIPNDQAPYIALAILKAAGYGQLREHLAHYDDIPAMVELAAGHLSDAVTIREREDARKLAAAELTRRRDELAAEIDKDATCYEATCAVARHAIDMIIRLQDDAEATK